MRTASAGTASAGTASAGTASAGTTPGRAASGGTTPGRSPSATGPAAEAIPAAGRRRRRGDDQQDPLFTSEELTGPPEGVPSVGGSPAVPALAPAEHELVAAWDLDAGLLLAERDRQRRRGKGPIPVMLPARLS